MLCPHCNINLNTITLKGTNIDICPTCHGIWLDDGELKKLVENKDEINGNLLKFVETGCNKEEKLWQNEIECPRCNTFK